MRCLLCRTAPQTSVLSVLLIDSNSTQEILLVLVKILARSS